jgi:hypothetical protein
MIIIDESISLNRHLSKEHKIKLLQEKIDILKVKLENEKLLKYPCSYKDHLIYKNKLKNIISYDPNIYLVFMCKELNKYEIMTHSQASNDIKRLVIQNELFN